MRTKLDQIIDEEAARPHKWDGDFFKRIAERAFRHGVERRQSVCRINSIEDVQPGPAGENPDLSSIPPRYIDRRKGERRKDHYTAYATVDLTGDRLFSTGMAWKLDRRRSGSDRRKK